jgi:hypothetical protein
MSYIVSYRKKSNPYTVIQLNTPEGANELCTLDGVTYVSIPDATSLPEQPAELDDITEVTVTDELRQQISDASPHVALIRERVRDKIAAVYSLHEEIKLLRTAPSPEFEAYNDHAEACREWGRQQKVALGL